MAKSHPSAQTKRKRFSLYWVTTSDGDEDWFVVAPTAREACRFFEEVEGYGRGDASSERVLDLPDELLTKTGWRDGPRGSTSDEAGWPHDACLKACGAEVDIVATGELQEAMGVVAKDVRIGGRLFRAGDVVTNIQERRAGRSRDN